MAASNRIRPLSDARGPGSGCAGRVQNRSVSSLARSSSARATRRVRPAPSGRRARGWCSATWLSRASVTSNHSRAMRAASHALPGQASGEGARARTGGQRRCIAPLRVTRRDSGWSRPDGALHTRECLPSSSVTEARVVVDGETVGRSARAARAGRDPARRWRAAGRAHVRTPARLSRLRRRGGADELRAGRRPAAGCCWSASSPRPRTRPACARFSTAAVPAEAERIFGELVAARRLMPACAGGKPGVRRPYAGQPGQRRTGHFPAAGLIPARNRTCGYNAGFLPHFPSMAPHGQRTADSPQSDIKLLDLPRLEQG